MNRYLLTFDYHKIVSDLVVTIFPLDTEEPIQFFRYVGVLYRNSATELKAVIKALKRIPKASHLMVHTTGYICGGLDRYRIDWQKNSWSFGSGKPVPNKELWGQINRMTKDRSITITAFSNDQKCADLVLKSGLRPINNVRLNF